MIRSSCDAAIRPNSNYTRVSFFRVLLTADIYIDASDTSVWSVLTNLDLYNEWNPVISYIRGDLVLGGSLDIKLQWPGLKKGTYFLKILGLVPNREFRWLGHFFIKGLMNGDHRFTIDPVSEGCVKLTQHEDFSGLLVPFFAPFLRRNVLSGFILMNESLKDRVESGSSGNALRVANYINS